MFYVSLSSLCFPAILLPAVFAAADVRPWSTLSDLRPLSVPVCSFTPLRSLIDVIMGRNPKCSLKQSLQGQTPIGANRVKKQSG